MSTKGNLALLLSSLAAGAALGLLLAPSSGRETRRNLVRRGEAMRDKLTDLYEEGTQYVNRGRQQFAEVADRAKDTVKSTSGNSGASSGTNSGGSSARPAAATSNGGSRTGSNS